ncbi:MAG TPA: hypothetical protein VD813_11200 [Pseudonocardia sp.]|nr:hypothetical protein [Pseudonocardia sp.]
MRRTTRLVSLAVLLGTLLLGGCANVVQGIPSVDPAPAPTEGPGSDPVTYADRLCGALLVSVTAVQNVPDFSGAGDLAGIRRTVLDYLDTALADIRRGRDDLAAAGRSPVSGGDELARAIDEMLAGFEQQLDEVRAGIEATDPSDLQAFLAAVGELESFDADVSTSFDELGPMPRLDRAFAAASTCQELEALSSI